MIKLTNIIFYFFLPGLVLCQNRSFDYYYRTLDSDVIYDAAEDDDGNFYLLSTTYDPNGHPSIASNITKLDPNGNFITSIILKPQYTATNLTRLFKVDGTHFIAAGTASLETNSSFTTLLVKFDNQLQINWTKSFKDTTKGLHIKEIDFSRDSSHFIVIGGAEELSKGFFAKISLTGDSIDYREYGFLNPFVLFFDILERPKNQGYYIFSLGAHLPSDTNSPSNSQLIIITSDLEVDSIVYLETSLTYPYFTGNVSFDNNITAKWITSETFIVGGLISDHKLPDLDYRSRDLGIMVWDTAFQEQYYQIFGRIDTNEFSGIRTMDFLDTTNIFLAGTNNFNLNFFADQVIDFYLVKTNSKGQAKWQYHYNNNSLLVLYSVLATSDGGALMVGSSYKEGINGPQESDGYALKVDSNGYGRVTPAGVYELKIDNNNFHLYPNPFNDKLSVNSYNPTTNFILELFNSLGQLVYQDKIRPGVNSMSTLNLEPGIYFYKLTNETGNLSSGKLIKN